MVRRSRSWFTEEGGKVLCVDINQESNLATVATIQASGTADAFLANISNREQMNFLIKRCIGLYGSIDMLVNNAGVNLRGCFTRLAMS